MHAKEHNSRGMWGHKPTENLTNKMLWYQFWDHSLVKVLLYGLLTVYVLCPFLAAFPFRKGMCVKHQLFTNFAHFTSQANCEQLIDKSEGTKPSPISALWVWFLYSLEVKSGKNWATKTRKHVDLRQISESSLCSHNVSRVCGLSRKRHKELFDSG